MSDPDKRKSAALTDGPERAAARAMLKGIGFTDDDLARPIIGVATTWIETMPCNWNQRELAQHVKRGIRAAGGTPMEFNTVAVSDGVSMGTEGMRASLVSREVIADSIELVARGHLFDGLVCLVGCDKTIPAAVMALARLDLPGLALYNGSIAPGRFRGRDVTIQDVFEAVGAHAVGKMSDEDLHELEGVACPGAGACGGQFTANTMSTALDFLGISPAGLNGIPALHPSKAEAAEAAGRLAMDLLRRDLRPSQIITRDALENAAASIVATGGSTNGVLHLLAIARELGVPFELDDFDRIAAETPIVASLKPGGQYVATDVYEAGGVALVARELLKKELVHADSPNVDGRSLGEIAAAVEEKPGQEVVVPIETPIKPIGGLAVLRGNLAPEGCVVKLAGHERLSHRGAGARLRLGGGVFRRREGTGDQGGRRGRHPLRGTGGRAGDAGDAARHGRARRRGARGQDRAHHRWALLRRDPRADGRAHLAGGGARRPHRGARERRHSRHRRRGANALGRALRRRAPGAALPLEPPSPALHERRLRQVRGARLICLRRGSDSGPTGVLYSDLSDGQRPRSHQERLREPALRSLGNLLRRARCQTRPSLRAREDVSEKGARNARHISPLP